MKCIVCSQDLLGKQTKFCSRLCHNRFGNHNHQSYLKQQERAASRKNELIKLFGSCCSICSYSKNYSALEFHHLDPSTKKFGLNARHLSNLTWESCLEESKKCDLICSNCHRELHHPQCVIV
jgi:hypothetical protein